MPNDQGLPPDNVTDFIWVKQHASERWTGPLTLTAAEVMALLNAARTTVTTRSRHANETINRLVGIGLVSGRHYGLRDGYKNAWRYDITPAGRAWLQRCHRAVETADERS